MRCTPGLPPCDAAPSSRKPSTSTVPPAPRAPRAATAPLRVLGAEVLSGGAEHAGKRGKVAGEGLRKALAQLGQKAELDEVGSPAPNPQRFDVCRVD